MLTFSIEFINFFISICVFKSALNSSLETPLFLRSFWSSSFEPTLSIIDFISFWVSSAVTLMFLLFISCSSKAFIISSVDIFSLYIRYIMLSSDLIKFEAPPKALNMELSIALSTALSNSAWVIMRSFTFIIPLP